MTFSNCSRACLLAVLLSSTGLYAQSGDQKRQSIVDTSATGNEQKGVLDVLDRYHKAVLSHDGGQLSALFLPQANIWLNVLSDQAYSRMRANTPTVSKIKVSSFNAFAKFISSTSQQLDPEHTNLIINTDGTIASVYFDFTFAVDGKVQNHGSESWQLVNTAEGWRIAAIIYSSDPS